MKYPHFSNQITVEEAIKLCPAFLKETVQIVGYCQIDDDVYRYTFQLVDDGNYRSNYLLTNEPDHKLAVEK